MSDAPQVKSATAARLLGGAPAKNVGLSCTPSLKIAKFKTTAAEPERFTNEPINTKRIGFPFVVIVDVISAITENDELAVDGLVVLGVGLTIFGLAFWLVIAPA